MKDIVKEFLENYEASEKNYKSFPELDDYTEEDDVVYEKTGRGYVKVAKFKLNEY